MDEIVAEPPIHRFDSVIIIGGKLEINDNSGSNAIFRK